MFAYSEAHSDKMMDKISNGWSTTKNREGLYTKDKNDNTPSNNNLFNKSTDASTRNFNIFSTK